MKSKLILRLIAVSISFISAVPCLYGQIEAHSVLPQRASVITVGSNEADIPGFTSEKIQIALDAVKSRGGGIVQLTPGTFAVNASIEMYSNTSLVGSGKATILKKSDGVKTGFLVDLDGGMLEAPVKDPSGFKTGMGIALYDDKTKSCFSVTSAKILDIKGNIICFDKHVKSSYFDSSNAMMSNTFSIIEGIESSNIRIADLVIEGNKAKNEYINGCAAGGVYIYRSNNCQIENVQVNEFNGDSFSWQTTENIMVKGCEASNGSGLGFHPGTGSYYTVIENCSSHDNGGDGIYLCWRVQKGVFKNNVIYGNKQYGISVGHRDTDNYFENNHVYENGQHGVYLRNEKEMDGGHRNTFVKNTVENNGTLKESAGFRIDGETHDITIENNIIRSTGKGNQASAIYIGKKASKVNYKNNQISGAKDILKE
jgi:hypothetical protein